MQTFDGTYQYYINVDERGDFFADVRDKFDDTVYEILNIDHLNELIECGYLNHGRDVEGLLEYLKEMKFVSSGSTLHAANF